MLQIKEYISGEHRRTIKKIEDVSELHSMVRPFLPEIDKTNKQKKTLERERLKETYPW